MNISKLLQASCNPAYWPALSRGVVPTIEHISPLSATNPDTIIDVGANKGQFSSMAARLWPAAKLIAFEPIPDQAEKFKSHLGVRAALHQCALADTKSEMELHIASRVDSSSLLPLDDRQKQLFGMDEIGTIIVPVRRLDEMLAEESIGSQALLKIDVQGFEYEVLKGAAGLMDRISWIYVEASFVELYKGQRLFPEIKELLDELGFYEIGRFNVASDDTGRPVQADILFSKDPEAAC